LAADHTVEDAADVAMALDALRRLSDQDRELLTLALWEELTNPEIAMVTETSVQNVSVRLHRAKQRFRDAFARLVQEASSTGHVQEGGHKRKP
jgi:RNA polymerase sigma-70 factor (ECF subfamily)